MSLKELRNLSFLYMGKNITIGEFIKLYKEYKERS